MSPGPAGGTGGDGFAAGLKLWIAQGFGIGRIPVAPGTFGSVLGVAWFGLLAWTGSFLLLLVGTVGGLLVSVWLCGEAEKILAKTDPGSVVLDEVTAIPFCFLGWACVAWREQGALPGIEYFFSGTNWLWTAAVFVLFRIFDIGKPWPVRQSQRLPGGWGVTIDDALAAIYVNAFVLVARAFISS